MTTTEMIAVLQAFERGEVIEYRPKNSQRWGSAEPIWNFSQFDYRVKPKPREWWLNVYERGSAISHHSRAEADRNKAYVDKRIDCVHVREVLGGQEEARDHA